ncbi:unnamed protein product [Lupinus luteus]|uniref:Uncharacterized protein n=1 Tax=Lupinus luteus TaxID=3873 RepID=A0AAV1VS77_LUPLU
MMLEIVKDLNKEIGKLVFKTLDLYSTFLTSMKNDEEKTSNNYKGWDRVLLSHDPVDNSSSEEVIPDTRHDGPEGLSEIV